jgi:phosphate/sulfate permease
MKRITITRLLWTFGFIEFFIFSYLIWYYITKNQLFWGFLFGIILLLVEINRRRKKEFREVNIWVSIIIIFIGTMGGFLLGINNDILLKLGMLFIVVSWFLTYYIKRKK